MSSNVDVSQMISLSSDFLSAGEATEAVKVSVRNALDTAKERARRDYAAFPDKGIAQVGAQFSYETKGGGAVVDAEFGPTKPRGALANIAVWGTSRGGGGLPHPADYMDDSVANEIADTMNEIVRKLS